jgi:hypothetical protein
VVVRLGRGRIPVLLGRVSLILAVFCSVTPSAVARSKLDRVILANGDEVTCEIKELRRGMLRVKTDSMGTIEIEWEDVVELTSPFGFEIELQNGFMYLGRFGTPTEEGTLRIESAEAEAVEIGLGRVVRINAIEDSFWKRLDGSLSLGFNYTKASDVGTLSFSNDTTYRKPRFLYTFTLNTIITTQEAKPTTKRGDLSFSYVRFRRNRVYVEGSVGAQTNDELGIDLRLLLGGGVGRNWKQTNRTNFRSSGGLVATEEWLTGTAESQTNLEMFGTVSYEFFRYNTPKSDIVVNLTVYPSLNDWGRIRTEFDSGIRQELIKDFFLEVSLYLSSDNRPPQTAAAKIDYGIVLSLGWTF